MHIFSNYLVLMTHIKIILVIYEKKLKIPSCISLPNIFLDLLKVELHT